MSANEVEQLGADEVKRLGAFSPVSAARSLIFSIFTVLVSLGLFTFYFGGVANLFTGYFGTGFERYLDPPESRLIAFSMAVMMIYWCYQWVGLTIDTRWSARDEEPSVWWKWFLSLLCGVSGRRRDGAIRDSVAIFAVNDSHAEWVRFHDALQFRKDRIIAPFSYAIWALPLIGFVGTVRGLSAAIEGLGASVEGGAVGGGTIFSVVQGLHTAFDTTFVALVCVLPLMILSMHLEIQLRWALVHKDDDN